MAVALAEFYLFLLSLLRVLRLICFKGIKFCWMNIFTIEMFFFANFVQKVDFDELKFQKVGVPFSEFYLFVVPALLALGEKLF